MLFPNSFGYAGYGPHADIQVVEAITGELPVFSTGAILHNVQLCVQGLDDIPGEQIPDLGTSIRELLRSDWGDTFETYTLRRQEGGRVHGRYFELSKGALARMLEWDFADEGWFETEDVTATITVPKRRFVVAQTTFLGQNQSVKRTVDVEQYDPFLNNKDKILEIARKIRSEDA